MKTIAIILSIIWLPIMGFSQQTIYGSITHDDMQREYILFVPAIYTGNSAVPLILNYHGYGSNASEQMNYGDFRPIADTAGFLVVHPQGTLHFGITHWNVGGWTIGSTADDVGFTAALIDSLAVEYCLDLTRIYATGMSNGGFMSFLLACQLSDDVAAIASVTGSMTPETYDDCSPIHPSPILQMHGTDDGVVPYDGALWTKPIDDVLQYWVDYNNCNTTPTIISLPDIDPNDGSTVEYIVYDEGDNGITTEHYKIIGGGHTWPGSALGGAGTNYDINASVEIWKFFSKYDLISITDIEQVSVNNLTIKIYPNPTNSYMNVELDFSEPVEYELISPIGRRVSYGVITTNHQRIDLSHLPPNIYILKIGNSTCKVLKVE